MCEKASQAPGATPGDAADASAAVVTDGSGWQWTPGPHPGAADAPETRTEKAQVTG